QIQHAKAFKKAKKSLGIRSIRDGFGNKGKWAWVLQAKPVKPAKKEADPQKDANSCEQVRSVFVDLKRLAGGAIERPHPSTLGCWHSSARRPSSTKGNSCASVASIHQRLPHISPG